MGSKLIQVHVRKFCKGYLSDCLIDTCDQNEVTLVRKQSRRPDLTWSKLTQVHVRKFCKGYHSEYLIDICDKSEVTLVRKQSRRPDLTW